MNPVLSFTGFIACQYNSFIYREAQQVNRQKTFRGY